MPKSPCPACKVVFASVSAFDKHRVGSFGKPLYDERKRFIGYSPHERRCLTEDKMVAASMSKNQRGLWITAVPDASALLRLKSAKIKKTQKKTRTRRKQPDQHRLCGSPKIRLLDGLVSSLVSTKTSPFLPCTEGFSTILERGGERHLNSDQRAPTSPNDEKCHLCGINLATRIARHIATRTTIRVCESQGCHDLVEMAQVPAALQRRFVGSSY